MNTRRLTAFICCLLAAICSCSALFCNECDKQQCLEAMDCPAGKVMDSCGCCEVCAIPEGGSCSTDEFGQCADDRFCLPDGGLLSGSIVGKCLDMTECFSFGCDVVDDETCECGYSNSCPTKTFDFDDLQSCNESLAENITEADCVHDGEILEEGETIKTDACTTCRCYDGELSCFQRQCYPVACPDNEELIHLPGDCCPSCQPREVNTTDCTYEGEVFEEGETIKPDPCTTCKCYEGDVVCFAIQCYPPICGDNEELVYPPEDCCPSCRPREVIDPPQIPKCAIEGEFVDPENPCMMCYCREGKTACYEQFCAPVVCEKPISVPDQCCPICEEVTELPSTAAPTTTEEPTTPSETVTTPTTTENTPSTTTATTSEPATEATTDLPVPPVSIRPTIPFVPQRCTRRQLFRHPDNFCLTCVCVRGQQRCVDQTRDLCGVPSCSNPVMIEGECCPVCIGNTDVEDDIETIDRIVPSDPIVLVTMVVDETMITNNGEDVLVELLESEMESLSYSLMDFQTVQYGKTQVELVIVAEGLEGSDVPKDQLSSVLLQRLSSMAPPTQEEDTRLYQTYISENVVIVVCVVSFLVAVVVVTVFAIVLIALWISRVNKRRRNSEKVAETEKA